MKPKDIRRDFVNVDKILDMLERHRELYLTIKAEDVKQVKQRLSQCKFKRGTEERLKMQESEQFTVQMPVPVPSYETPEPPLEVAVVDLHLTLGGGADIFVISCREADDTL